MVANMVKAGLNSRLEISMKVDGLMESKMDRVVFMIKVALR